jgi:hypothetical protein
LDVCKNVLCGLGIIDTLDLEERCVGIRVALAALVRQVLAFHVYCLKKQDVSLNSISISAVRFQFRRTRNRVVLTSVTAAGDHLDGIVCERAKGEMRPRDGELVVVGFRGHRRKLFRSLEN